MIFYAMPGNEVMAAELARRLHGSTARLGVHRFPDRESVVRIEPPPPACDAVLVCTMDDPDPKLAPLLFAAATLRDEGARSVGLVAPYLAYMRQDHRFAPGESVSSRHFARVISSHFDWLVTVDPHLHRYASLDEIYSIPTEVVHAAPEIARWINASVARPVLVGPDEESRQWVEEVAGLVHAPCVVLSKDRMGDRDVRVFAANLSEWRQRTPVLIDDIVSTGGTLVATLEHLRERGLPAPACVAVHGLFSGDALDRLKRAGAERIVTTNTVPGEWAGIDISEAVATRVGRMVECGAPAGATPSLSDT
jgi:ribose-phosphate pyrophosphokinase